MKSYMREATSRNPFVLVLNRGGKYIEVKRRFRTLDDACDYGNIQMQSFLKNDTPKADGYCVINWDEYKIELYDGDFPTSGVFAKDLYDNSPTFSTYTIYPRGSRNYSRITDTQNESKIRRRRTDVPDVDVNGFSYKEAKKNTDAATLGDGYDHALLLEPDGSFTISRLGYGKPIGWFPEGTRIIYLSKTKWDGDCLQAVGEEVFQDTFTQNESKMRRNAMEAYTSKAFPARPDDSYYSKHAYERTYDEDGMIQMLGRLVADCEYWLGNGNRYDGHLWAGDPCSQIEEMQLLYDHMPESAKQVCRITQADIDNYRRQMCSGFNENKHRSNRMKKSMKLYIREGDNYLC